MTKPKTRMWNDAWKSLSIGLLMLVIPTLVIAYSLVGSITDSIQVFKSESWSTQNAVVLDAKIETQRGRKTGRSYWCEIAYRYRANGQVQSAVTKIFERNAIADEQAVTRECQMLSVYPTIEIKTDPGNPAWSCYRCGLPFDFWFYGLLSLLVLVAIAVFGFFLLVVTIQGVSEVSRA